MHPSQALAREADPAARGIAAAVRDTVFSPIGGGGLVEQTVRRLGEAIGMGLLSVGEQLPAETDLSARLDISPMTLRQALTILRETGYIETKRGKQGGTFVKRAKPFPLTDEYSEVSAEHLRDLTEFRAAVSGRATALAAERATEEEINHLSALTTQMTGKRSFARYRQLDGQFHLGIAAASKSRRLIETEAAIQRELLPVLALACDHPTKLGLQASNDQHAQILTAISNRDAGTAQRLMEAHVQATADFLVELRFGMLTSRAGEAVPQRVSGEPRGR
jgi:DNA-binding FadR family transcriptional regulator